MSFANKYAVNPAINILEYARILASFTLNSNVHTPIKTTGTTAPSAISFTSSSFILPSIALRFATMNEMPDTDRPKTSNATLNKLRAAVLGANDGIVSTASVVMGVAGATTDTNSIVTAGLAALVAGALSMAVGEYVSVSSQRDAEKVNAGHAESDDFTNPWAAAVSSLVAFTAGGLVPFLVVLVTPAQTRLAFTVGAVVVALVVMGYVSAKVGNASAPRAVWRVVAGGLVAMAVTYFIGTLFGASLA